MGMGARVRPPLGQLAMIGKLGISVLEVKENCQLDLNLSLNLSLKRLTIAAYFLDTLGSQPVPFQIRGWQP